MLWKPKELPKLRNTAFAHNFRIDPNIKTRELRDLVRRRHYFVKTMTMFKNNVHVELSKRWIDYYHSSDLFTEKGSEYLCSLKIAAEDDCLDTINFLDRKVRQLDNEIKKLAAEDRYANT